MSDPEITIRLANSLKDIPGVCKLDTVFTCSGRGESEGVARPPRGFDMVAKMTDDLSGIEREEIFAIFESSMKDQYIRNWGWNPVEKRNELFHPMSRFLCVYEHVPSEKTETETESNSADQVERTVGTDAVEQASIDTVFDGGAASKATKATNAPEGNDGDRGSQTRRKCVAYTTFRFEWDDEEEPEYPVLYCYELQVSPGVQGCGIGRWLMESLEIIARKLNLWKVLLTCFVSNAGALKFYKSIGFDTDVNSPIAMGMTDCAYEILSNKPHLR